jgi:hypothetical protein
MPEADRTRCIAELRWLSVNEGLHENNIARNRATMISLGLMNPKVWGGAEAVGAKRKSKKGRKGKKKRSKKGGEEDEEEESSGEGVDPKPAPRAPCAPRNTAKKAAAPKEWVVKAKAELEGTEGGEEWSALLLLWFKREEMKGFEALVRSLGLSENERVLTMGFLLDTVTFGEETARGGQGVGPACAEIHARNRQRGRIRRAVVGLVD